MSGPRAVGSALVAGAQKRPRRRYFVARILLDAGLAVFAVGALLALGINGGAGYQPTAPTPLLPTSIPDQLGLSAPAETGQSVAVADAGTPNRLAATPIRALPTPLIAPIPTPPPLAAVAAGTISLVGVAAMLAGLVMTGVTVARRRYGAARSPSTTKSSSRPV